MTGIMQVLADRFILLVSLPRNRVDLARAAVEAGADALKVHLNCEHFASGTHFGSWLEEREAVREILDAVPVPVGVVTGAEVQPTDEEVEEIAGFGFTFWDLFVHHVPPRFLELDMSRMVAVDPAWTQEMIRDMVCLGVQVVEASIVPRTEYRTPLNLRDLTRYASLVRASTAPVVVPTQKAIRPDEVSFLRQVGANGIAIGAVVTGHDIDSLRSAVAAFRASIDAMRRAGRR